ncbi:hypothetical protein L2E82_02742 [Cichorium intybus]|uniref:Uncharacterized protein n=1 Tax=Cichorium intybus TaxID=13427 RepID=A0ACB9H443_CICIN|nr:hypothetical protein L2E82_02742 [Cichorium intybus]
MSLKLNVVVGSLRPPQVNIIFLNSTSFHPPWRPHRRKRSTYLVIRSNHHPRFHHCSCYSLQLHPHHPPLQWNRRLDSLYLAHAV